MDIGIGQARFKALAREHRRRWAVRLAACDVEGAVVWATPASPKRANDAAAQQARATAIAEAHRWGDPTFHLAPGGRLIWAAPLMHNARLLGGIVAAVAESRAFAGDLDVRRAATELRDLLERQNLTNAALLAERRAASHREQTRAQAIHELKLVSQYNLRRMYLLEEPTLVAAIRRGDRGEARAALNRLLVAMLHQAGTRLDLAKSFFMELVASMTRTAVEAGGDPQALLGANFASLAELAGLDDEEQLAAWLGPMLEQVLDALAEHRRSTDQVLLANAVRYMSEHCGEDLGRDRVADLACMSPSHFSRQFRKHFGQSFGELLNRMRIDRAAELLTRTDRPLSVIGLECGFADQSYFTKVFRKHRGKTPLAYRRDYK